MSWHKDFDQNRTLITVLHMILWAVLGGVGIVTIVIIKLFTWPFIAVVMISTFIVSIPLSWAIARAMIGQNTK